MISFRQKGDFSKHTSFLEKAKNAVIEIIKNGIDVAMNKYN